jgi:2-polyprenyl-3-methyl-5-hydroxy-6-metoxy-1,4-benzoquinol methylase
MQTIHEKERDKYADIWNLPDYSNFSPGEQMIPMFLSIARPKPYSAIIDVGCGGGAASRALHKLGYRVSAFDLTDQAWQPTPGITMRTGTIWNGIPLVPMFDYAYCCDMMEHIPTQFVALSISNILSTATYAFFSISFTDDHFGSYIGESLHLTVKPFTWWRDTLREICVVEEARDMQGEGIFYVRNK